MQVQNRIHIQIILCLENGVLLATKDGLPKAFNSL